ncbi:terpenoid cyclases/protein prenyltransferase alpha-alpha toroid [Lineolata rhizophorae]|uniref:Terpenoid cyclases/protein prenyltransferase alpha-alpha toroid n=1 Tax=Lineolata rhizophorae TaxID=578093 RepID=A0A6A6NUE5_9PEZI|nr:terpenoid cyclases/protein prenyltransferase alpha-alpha toroid [Lineolata rhizophorae]
MSTDPDVSTAFSANRTAALPLHPPPTPPAPPHPEFQRSRHVSYWKRCLKTFLPAPYTPMDSTRLMLSFFVLSPLDLLGELVNVTTPAERANYANWIYACQLPSGGFRASPSMSLGARREEDKNGMWDPAHVPATYFALASLCILKDDFKRVKRKECLRWLKKMQRDDGSFGQTLGADGAIEGGRDMRFGYCVMCSRWILRAGKGEKDLVGVEDIDIDGLVRCIRASETYDGGISDEPFHEAHAGFTYCAIAALSIAGRLPDSSNDTSTTTKQLLTAPSNVPLTLHWLASRQTTSVFEEEPLITKPWDFPSANRTESELGLDHNEPDVPPAAGFNGRANKVSDTCYAFWVGASMSLLEQCAGAGGGGRGLADSQRARTYLVDKSQHLVGGFGKVAGDPPDVYHSSLGLAALAMLGERNAATGEGSGDGGEGLKTLDPGFCMSVEARGWAEGVDWDMEESEESKADEYAYMRISGG